MLIIPYIAFRKGNRSPPGAAGHRRSLVGIFVHFDTVSGRHLIQGGNICICLPYLREKEPPKHCYVVDGETASVGHEGPRKRAKRQERSTVVGRFTNKVSCLKLPHFSASSLPAVYTYHMRHSTLPQSCIDGASTLPQVYSRASGSSRNATERDDGYLPICFLPCS